VQQSLSSYLSTYLNLDLGWTLLAAGFALSVVQIAGMTGRILWGRVADGGLGVRRTLILLASIMVAGCLAASMFSSDTSHYWIYAVLIVFGASGAGWNGVYLAEVARLAPAGKVGLATGGTLAFTYLGIVFWMPLFGLIADATGGYRMSYLLFCVPLLVCLGFFFRQGKA
jgi:MFS family permease